jgi:hypothetical protein
MAEFLAGERGEGYTVIQIGNILTINVPVL